MQHIERFAWQQMAFGTVFASVGIGAILAAFWYMWVVTP
jgi:hypothetical protein